MGAFCDIIGGLADLAGMMAPLDFVVNTATHVIHLTGAMGIEDAEILSANAYAWNWGIAGSKRNMWYPTVENWHAPHPLASWREIISEAAQHLHAHLHNRTF